MFCNQCGNSVDENAKFCNQCGNVMEKATEPIFKYCSQCANRIEEGQSFCIKCGQALKNSSVKSALKKDRPLRKKKNFMPLFIIAGVLIFSVAAFFIGFKVKDHFKPIKAEIESEDLDKDNMEAFEDNIEVIEEEETPATEDDTEIDEVEETTGSLYLFPSDRKYITEEDLDSLTREEIALIRNEVFARHGYIFTKEPYLSYFTYMPWYIPNENFTDSVFSEIEKTNVDNIVIYERKMGW